MPRSRAKTRQLTLSLDPKYDRQLLFLKYTGGITKFLEAALDKVEIDEALMRSIERVEMARTLK